MRSMIGFLSLLALAAAPPPAPEEAPSFGAPLEFDNEFMPFEPGAMKLYVGRSTDGFLAVADLYLTETRSFELQGKEVECAILQETEFVAGALVEISRNFFAQANDGTVFYFGELVDNYEDGKIVDHDGSWLVGGPTDPSDPPGTVKAQVPAVFMPPDPQTGDSWKPEDLFPIVDETVTVVADDVNIKVPAGKFEGAIKVKETSQLEDGFECKWYAPGIGVVKTLEKGEALRLVASTLGVDLTDEGDDECDNDDGDDDDDDDQGGSDDDDDDDDD